MEREKYHRSHLHCRKLKVHLPAQCMNASDVCPADRGGGTIENKKCKNGLPSLTDLPITDNDDKCSPVQSVVSVF